jgi:hypothetical protein
MEVKQITERSHFSSQTEQNETTCTSGNEPAEPIEKSRKSTLLFLTQHPNWDRFHQPPVLHVEPKKSFIYNKILFCIEPNEPNEPRAPKIGLRNCADSRNRIL